ncbi:MAG: LysM peptidoglycan-binding domain-containing protein [Actinomycetota bacterium]
MHRTYVRRRRVLATFAVSIALWLVVGPAGQAVEARRTAGLEGGADVYVVRPGDTLWSIARAVAPSEDPRPLVDSIAAANDVEAGSIVPGQALLVPSGG